MRPSPILPLSALLLAACGTAIPMQPASTEMRDRVASLTRDRCAPGIASALQTLGVAPASVMNIRVTAPAGNGGGTPNGYDADVVVQGRAAAIINLDFNCLPLNASQGGTIGDAMRFRS